MIISQLVTRSCHSGINDFIDDQLEICFLTFQLDVLAHP